MDIQLKRGILDLCVLTAIKNEPSYGYKIIKDLKPYMEMSESTLYTILKRLEVADMLTVTTSEHDGRLRKYYKITKTGLGRIEDFKEKWRDVDVSGAVAVSKLQIETDTAISKLEFWDNTIKKSANLRIFLFPIRLQTNIS